MSRRPRCGEEAPDFIQVFAENGECLIGMRAARTIAPELAARRMEGIPDFRLQTHESTD